MGKHSDFARTEKDRYQTPAKAVEPLLRWLRPNTRFIEPCCGDGALASFLEAHGHRLIGGFDWPKDARSAHYGVEPGELFITNPPYWGRPEDLHPLIENLSNQAPTWLLLPSDWLFNRSSCTLTRRLRRIIAVGRVKWIPGSQHTGKENAAWLLFSYPVKRPGFFVGREPQPRVSKPQREKVMAHALAGDRMPPSS
jgi:hypothetical protein